MPGTSACAACGALHLSPHMTVAGEVGSQGLIPTTDHFGSALGDIVRCGRCGHMQVDPMPERAVLENGYAQAASADYVGEEAGQRETARRALELIERYSDGSRELLDLGCWVGFLLAEARDRGWKVTGIEPSEFGSAYARDRLGLNVITADLLSTPLPSTTFGAVTMGDVIEHLIAPAEALARIRDALAPGGVIWIALPDAGSRLARAMGRRWWSVVPTHVQYFTRRSISTLLARQGFEVLRIETAPKAFTVRYYLERIGGYSPGAARALVAGARSAGLAEQMWAPDFHDRMAVLARLSA